MFNLTSLVFGAIHFGRFELFVYLGLEDILSLAKQVFDFEQLLNGFLGSWRFLVR